MSGTPAQQVPEVTGEELELLELASRHQIKYKGSRVHVGKAQTSLRRAILVHGLRAAGYLRLQSDCADNYGPGREYLPTPLGEQILSRSRA